MKTILTFTLMFILGLEFSTAQDTILYMNGKMALGKVQKTANTTVYFIPDNKNTKIKKIDIEDLFSINYQNKSMVYYYAQDTAIGNNMNLDEMNTYVMGKNYARVNFKSPNSTLGGIVTGAAGAFSFWGLALPVTYALIVGSKNPRFEINEKMKQEIYSNPVIDFPTIAIEPGLSYDAKNDREMKAPIFNEPLFQEGYNRAAKDKKVKNSLKGALVGFTAMIGTFVLISVGR